MEEETNTRKTVLAGTLKVSNIKPEKQYAYEEL
jgi:hypothetical protein